MNLPGWLVVSDPRRARLLRGVLRRLPEIEGAPIRVTSQPRLRDRRGAVDAGAFLRQRKLVFACTRAEFPRIFAHELFHFVWLRAGNRVRRAWEAHLAAEWRSGARGELGWSAEWRKRALDAAAIAARSRRWREYCCESFCDTAAWLYGGAGRHAEFTLAPQRRKRRAAWFEAALGGRRLSV